MSDKANFPAAIWDGKSSSRNDINRFEAPRPEDWNRLVAELIATQSYIVDLGLGDPADLDSRFAAIDHDHDTTYAALDHNHDTAYAPISTFSGSFTTQDGKTVTVAGGMITAIETPPG